MLLKLTKKTLKYKKCIKLISLDLIVYTSFVKKKNDDVVFL